MKIIRRNGGEYTDLMFRVLERNITIEELKDAVMYALEYGTEEVGEPKIPYVNTSTENVDKVINSNLVEIQNANINYVDPTIKQKNIPVNDFVGYLLHLNQSGIFSGIINWRYVELFDSGDYLIEGDIGHNNGYELNVAIAIKNVEDKDKVAGILKVEE